MDKNSPQLTWNNDHAGNSQTAHELHTG